MSDTPETDAQLTTYTSISKSGKHFTNKKGTVSADVARKLERERDEARRDQSSIQCAFEDSQDKIEQLERERDQWKSKFVQANKDYGFELRDPCGTIWDHAKKLQQECDNLQDQRDEARIQYRSTLALAEVLANTQVKLVAERDEARKALNA